MNVSTAIANTDQAAAWDGAEGAYWAANEQRFDLAVHNYHRRFFDAVPIGSDLTVLDVGCGNGQTTREAAHRAIDGSALGIDLSARMIERARQRAREQGLTNATFVQGDAQVHAFAENTFDLAISRFGAMFFADPVAAFGNIARSLRPGGQLAMLAWQPLADNEWLEAIRSALAAGRTLPEPPPKGPSAFGLSQPAHVRDVLARAGYVNVDLVGAREPVFLGADADDAFTFVSGLSIVPALLEDLHNGDRAQALDALRVTLAAHQADNGVLMNSTAWLITAQHQ